MFICQVLCTGIQGIYALLMGGPLAKEGSSAKYEHTSKLLLNNFQCNCLQEIHFHFGVSIGQSRFICQVGCTDIQGISAWLPGGSICQSMFICQVLCTGIQGIYALLMGGPLAKEGSSAKYEHTSKLLLNNFQCNCLQEIHFHFGVSIGQSRFICQVGCTDIQGISAWLPGGSICQSMFICQVLCTSIQGIYALLIGGGPLAKEGSSAKYEHTSKLLLNNFQCNCIQEIHSHFGGPSAKVGSSAKFGIAVFKASILNSLGVHQVK